MSKLVTNEQRLRKFFKELHTIEIAILRERLVKISELTRQDIEEGDRKPYNTFATTANDFLILCDKIDKHLGFELDKS